VRVPNAGNLRTSWSWCMHLLSVRLPGRAERVQHLFMRGSAGRLRRQCR